MVANEFVGLSEAVGQGIVREELVGAFVNLLKDNEAEVRTAGAGQVPGELRRSSVVIETNIKASLNCSTEKLFLLEFSHASKTSPPTRASMFEQPLLCRSQALRHCWALSRPSSTSCPSFCTS